nr:uncharacterized protein LOC109764622 [Aegilops tauschii subsp. strangulata]
MSRDAWTALHTRYVSQSRARAHAIRTELGEVKLNDLNVTDYFNKVTGMAGTLASISQALGPEEFSYFVLNGLGDNYDNLVDNINGRDTPIQPRELYVCLLATEHRIQARRSTSSFPSANAATRGKRKSYKPPIGAKHPLAAPNPRNSTTFAGGRGRAYCPSCGAQVPCQLCGLDGHLASRCHRRFKQDFLRIGNNGKGNEKQAALASHEQGHTPSYHVDASWYTDT